MPTSRRPLQSGDLRGTLTGTRETVSAVTPVFLKQPQRRPPAGPNTSAAPSASTSRRARRSLLQTSIETKTAETLAQITAIRDQIMAATNRPGDGPPPPLPLGALLNHVPTCNQAATVTTAALTVAAIAEHQGFERLAHAARYISQTASTYHPQADASALASQCADIRAMLHPAGAHDPAQQLRAPPPMTAIAQPPPAPCTDSLFTTAAKAGGPLPRCCFDPPPPYLAPRSIPQQAPPPQPSPRWPPPTTRDDPSRGRRWHSRDECAPYDHRHRSRSKDRDTWVARGLARAQQAYPHGHTIVPRQAATREWGPSRQTNYSPRRDPPPVDHRRDDRPTTRTREAGPPPPPRPPAVATPPTTTSRAPAAAQPMVHAEPPGATPPDTNPAPYANGSPPPQLVGAAAATAPPPAPSTGDFTVTTAATTPGHTPTLTPVRQQIGALHADIASLLLAFTAPPNEQPKAAGPLLHPGEHASPNATHRLSATRLLLPDYVSSPDQASQGAQSPDSNTLATTPNSPQQGDATPPSPGRTSPTLRETVPDCAQDRQQPSSAQSPKPRRSSRLHLQHNKQRADELTLASPTVMGHTSPSGMATSPDLETDFEYVEWHVLDSTPPTPSPAHDTQPHDALLERVDPVSPLARSTSPPPYSPPAQGRPHTCAITWPAQAKHAPAEAQGGPP